MQDRESVLALDEDVSCGRPWRGGSFGFIAMIQ